MSVTFQVDEVARTTAPLPTRPLAEVVGEVLALGGEPATPMLDLGPTHPLLGAVHLAFSQHRGLVLSPDAVWLTIAQGVAHHVRLHAEALRPRLVRHDGKRRLIIERAALPASADDWRVVVDDFSAAIAQQVGDGRARLLRCDFSTTTPVERVASDIVLMDVYSPYFDYYMMCICGIPEVTLLGDPEDWRAIRARIDVIAELDLGFWTASLVPICDQLVRAAEGSPDPAFWRRIYKPADAYGGEIITGWIARLYPYLSWNGRARDRNPLLELPIDEPRDTSQGIRSDDVLGGMSRARVVIVDQIHDEVRHVDLHGGLIGATVDGAGNVVPACGWYVLPAQIEIHDVIERIRDEHRAVPAAATRQSIEGPADWIALYDAFEEATLFADAAPWHLRASRDVERIELASGESLTRFLDLPDGTYVALADGDTCFVVHGLADALGPIAGPGPQGIEVLPRRRSSSQRAEELPVVGTSIAELLTRVLDSGGNVDLPEIARFVD